MSSRPTRTLLPGPGPYLGDEEVAVTMQVAIHLNDAEHEAFSRWLASAAVAVDRIIRTSRQAKLSAP
jgi:hypothetical protein